MKTRIKNTISLAIILLICLLVVRPVFAHGDDARIEISPEKLNPGGVLDIRGVSFEPEAGVTLALVGSQTEVPLGTSTTDTEGGFQLTIALPVDLAEGVYVVRGITEDDHSLNSPELTIWGSADLGAGEGGPIAEDDTLLMPFPTVASGLPTPMMASTILAQTPEKQESSAGTINSTVPYSLIATGVGIALLLILFLVLKRR